MTNTNVKIAEVDLSNCTNKSEKIRYLHSLGYKTGEIAKLLDIRYQHARNVIITPVKKT